MLRSTVLACVAAGTSGMRVGWRIATIPAYPASACRAERADERDMHSIVHEHV